MTVQRNKILAAGTLASLVLAGCGGGGDAAPVATTPPAPTVVTISAAGIVKYFTDMIAGTSETTDPVDASLVELAVDDKAEPGAL